MRLIRFLAFGSTSAKVFLLPFDYLQLWRVQRLRRGSASERIARGVWSGGERAWYLLSTNALEGTHTTMPTQAKAQEIDELVAQLERLRAAVLMRTEGLTVAEITDLRRKLGAQNVELHVVKNTLLRIAAERAGYQDISEYLQGQTTIAMGFDDEVAPAKLVSDYLRTARTGKPAAIKAGILERNSLTAAQVADLAKTPSKDQLRAQIVGAIQGPMSQTYGVISAPLRDLINVLEARIRELGGEPAAA
jgi:large subunit ribosomal protein L10